MEKKPAFRESNGYMISPGIIVTFCFWPGGYVRTGGVGLPINNSWMRMKSPLGDPVPIRRLLHHHFRGAVDQCRREGWPCGRKTGGTGMTKTREPGSTVDGAEI